jgi:hypothetical protein
MLLNRRQECLELESTHDEGDVTSPKWAGMDCRDSCHMEHRIRHTSCDLAVPPMAVYRSHNTLCATKLHYNAIVVLSLAGLLSRRL